MLVPMGILNPLKLTFSMNRSHLEDSEACTTEAERDTTVFSNICLRVRGKSHTRVPHTHTPISLLSSGFGVWVLWD